MSTQLQSQGIRLMEGYRAENLDPAPDLVVVGNAMSRGNAEVEAVLERGLPYVSGPQWLYEHVLKDRWVLAVAGTHGKTTTTSLLAWILEDCGYDPGFLVGGIPQNFGLSARLGSGPHFVVEADEYDTAFFDKRSKFVHYRPRTAVLNNLEYDHADIFPDLTDIQRQFHHLVRTVPGNGLLIAPQNDAALDETLAMGCWTPVQRTALNSGESDWSAQLLSEDGGKFAVSLRGRPLGEVAWSMVGRHNVMNALSALAAASHAGVEPERALQALARFQGIKRRLELRAQVDGVSLYDDFAHHPTAVRATLEAYALGWAKIASLPCWSRVPIPCDWACTAPLWGKACVRPTARCSIVRRRWRGICRRRSGRPTISKSMTISMPWCGMCAWKRSRATT